MKGIRAALNALEVKGVITFERIDESRVKVFVNSKYFGIWDAVKKTFVD